MTGFKHSFWYCHVCEHLFGTALFCPIGTCPAIALATADLPIGQKKDPLCALCVSVVNS
jgi:hypothetical protein